MEFSLGPSQLRHILLRILFFVGFVVTGVVTTALGYLAIYINWWSLSDAQRDSSYDTIRWSMVGVGLSSLLLSSRGYRTTLVLGYG